MNHLNPEYTFCFPSETSNYPLDQQTGHHARTRHIPQISISGASTSHRSPIPPISKSHHSHQMIAHSNLPSKPKPLPSSVILKQSAHALPIMHPPHRLRKRAADIQHL